MGESAASKGASVYLASIKQTDASVVTAAIGYALCVSSLEAWRFPAASAYVSGDSLSMFAFFGALACAVAYWVGKAGLLRSDAFALACGGLSAVSLSVYFLMGRSLMQSIWSSFAGQSFSFFSAVLLVVWTEEILRMGASRALLALLWGSLAMGVTQVVVGVLITGIALGACIMLPVVSSVLVVLFRLKRRYLLADKRLERAFESTGESQGMLSLGSLKGDPAFWLTALSALFYSIVFSKLHGVWIGLHLDDVAMAVQLFGAAGSFVAAGALLLTIAGRRTAIEAVVMLFTLVALYLSTLSSLQLPWYLVFLNAAQKLLFALIVLVALSRRSMRESMVVACALWMAYRLGMNLLAPVSAALDVTASEEVVGIAPLVVSSVGLVAVFLVALFVDRDGSRVSGCAPDEDAVCEGREQGKDKGVEYYKRVAFRYYFAQRYELTPRELDVTFLLDDGMNAAAIGRELVMSQATAKSHLRNVYQKLGVHSLQEAQALIARERKSF